MRLIGRNETIAGAMYSPKLVREVLRALGKPLVDDGRLDSVSLYSAGPTADFPELDSKEICSIQSKSRKGKEKKMNGC